MVAAVIIPLILTGAYFCIESTVEPLVQMPMLASLRATLAASFIVTCFLLLVTNYVLVRIAVARTAGRKTGGHISKLEKGGNAMEI